MDIVTLDYVRDHNYFIMSDKTWTISKLKLFKWAATSYDIIVWLKYLNRLKGLVGCLYSINERESIFTFQSLFDSLNLFFISFVITTT